jgi:hypothetical protein
MSPERAAAGPVGGSRAGLSWPLGPVRSRRRPGNAGAPPGLPVRRALAPTQLKPPRARRSPIQTHAPRAGHHQDRGARSRWVGPPRAEPGQGVNPDPLRLWRCHHRNHPRDPSGSILSDSTQMVGVRGAGRGTGDRVAGKCCQASPETATSSKSRDARARDQDKRDRLGVESLETAVKQAQNSNFQQLGSEPANPSGAPEPGSVFVPGQPGSGPWAPLVCGVLVSRRSGPDNWGRLPGAPAPGSVDNDRRVGQWGRPSPGVAQPAIMGPSHDGFTS